MGTDQNKEQELELQEEKDKYPELPPQMKKFAMIMFLFIGIAIGAFIFANPFAIPFLPGGAKQEKAAQVSGSSEEKKETLWTCPMHPNVLEKNPGECPICGMDLVPVYEDKSGEADEEGAIRIDPVTIQNIGIRSEEVVKGTLTQPIRTVGIVDYNEKNIFWVTTKFDGWIEKVYVNYVGERVKKGQPLFEIYSPELVSTQQEYLTAFDYRASLAKSNSPDVIRKADELLKATRERLRYWDITERQIEELEKTRKVKRTLIVTSLVAGLVVDKMEAALEGMYVKPGMNLYRIADLSSVWIHADIFESEAPWIREGQKAEVELSYFPGETFRGKVLFIQPFLKEKTRTIKVCIELPNPKERLRPGMYVNVKLLPVVSRTALMVPENAVIQSGERNVVFIDLGKGRFRPQEVELGVQGERVFEVKSGLKEGQKVVVSAQFLLDSESNLQEALRKMLPPGNKEEKPATMEQADHEKGGRPVMIAKQSENALLKAVSHYEEIWNKLAQDTVEGIKDSLAQFRTELASLKKSKAPDNFLSLAADALAAAKKMEHKDLAGTREGYKELSKVMIDLLKGVSFRTREKPQMFYIEYCSMVDAYWIQDSPEVRNPYYGASMLKCGEQKGMIHVGMKH